MHSRSLFTQGDTNAHKFKQAKRNRVNVNVFIVNYELDQDYFTTAERLNKLLLSVLPVESKIIKNVQINNSPTESTRYHVVAHCKIEVPGNIK